MSDGNAAELPGAASGLSPAGLIAVAWVGFAVAAWLVGLRLYARISENRTLRSDDYCLLLALSFLLANAILQTLQTQSLYYLVRYGAGQVPGGQQLKDHGNNYVRYQFAVIAIFWSVLWSVKASFLALYYRFFRSKTRYRTAWWCSVTFTALAYVGCWIASVWTCHPPSNYFNFGQCMKPIDTRGSIVAISYSTAVDVLSDLLMMLLPIGLLRDLQVDRRQKIGLAGIFSVGWIIIAAAIIRCTQIVANARTDPVGLAVWGLVESSISVMVGSLPALKAFFSRAVHRTLHRSYEGDFGILHDRDIPIPDSNPIRRTRMSMNIVPLEDHPRSESQQHITQKSFDV
ncbi:hypothetical protein KC330_g6287 [Hortaea werneckii]|nr:hypothetical protein KC330_g6287 [Hortaea werneckii]